MSKNKEKQEKAIIISKIDIDFANDMKSPEVRDFVTLNNLDLNRVRHWYRRPHEIFEEHGSDFNEFAKNCGGLVKRGDEIMLNVGSTGFNIDRFDIFTDEHPGGEDDMPTIFYNCYIERPMHFALLLSDIERIGIIGPDDRVDFSCKGTKVNWKWGESDSEREVVKVKRSDGTVVAVKSTMETVLRLSLSDWDKLALILDYFDSHVFLNVDAINDGGCIPWSFQDPDIRVLPDFIESGGLMTQPSLVSEVEERYKAATMNELSGSNGRLLVLRQKSSFNEDLAYSGWVSKKIVVNKELFDYLKSDDVKP